MDEKLILVKNDPQFYMTSYVMYVLVVRSSDYPRLMKRGSMQDANSWPHIVYGEEEASFQNL